MTATVEAEKTDEIRAMSDEDVMSSLVVALNATRTRGWYDRVQAEDWMHALLAEAQRRDLKLLNPSL
ncbi:MAG TPA: hypothetical protein VF221_22825 [Chloroflexota bacterium]